MGAPTDDSQDTCWTEIHAAGRGLEAPRSRFAARYSPLVDAALRARWPGERFADQRDDALQEVFVECFREGGVLERADAGRAGGFRAFLFGVVRNVARRHEERFARRRDDVPVELDTLERREATLSQAFDRAWAETLVREAAMRQQAQAVDEGAKRRVELLRLRFQEGRPIREIAREWGDDATRVHREYARAREEFERSLMEVLRFQHGEAGGPSPSPDALRVEARQLLTLLGAGADG